MTLLLIHRRGIERMTFVPLERPRLTRPTAKNVSIFQPAHLGFSYFFSPSRFFSSQQYQNLKQILGFSCSYCFVCFMPSFGVKAAATQTSTCSPRVYTVVSATFCAEAHVPKKENIFQGLCMYLHLVWIEWWSQTDLICLYKQISLTPACLVSAGLDVCQSVCMFGLWKASQLCCRDTRQRQPLPFCQLPVSSKTTFQPKRRGHVIDRSSRLKYFFSFWLWPDYFPHCFT